MDKHLPTPVKEKLRNFIEKRMRQDEFSAQQRISQQTAVGTTGLQ